MRELSIAEALWIIYYVECERYDRLVCTGNIFFRDGLVMPSNGEEYALINRHARKKLHEIISIWRQFIDDALEWRYAKRRIGQMSFEEQSMLYLQAKNLIHSITD